MPRSILRSVFGKRMRSNDPEPTPASNTLPSAGNVFAFRTSPYSEFAPSATDRYAAFKVLDCNEKYVAIAVLSGVWDTPPSLKDVRGAPILREHRFAHTGRPAVFGVNADWWKPADLNDVFLLGDDRISTEEAASGASIVRFGVGSRYSTLKAANYAAEGEWRWTHDRDALVAEATRKKAQDDAARAAREERYRTRLKNLTWDQLLTETPFERWSPSPPFPPEGFTAAARTTIHDACRTLSNLGPKPRKAEVRAVLRECVEWFNEADERAGGVIETEEREDICATLEEMAFVAGQKGLVDEIDRWRAW